MFEKLKVLAARLDELEMRLSAPDLYDDPDRAAKLLRERNELEPIVTAFREYEQAQRTLADATEMLSDPDMKELAPEEFAEEIGYMTLEEITAAGYYPDWMQPHTYIVYDENCVPEIIAGGEITIEDAMNMEEFPTMDFCQFDDEMKIEPNTKAEYDLHGELQNIYHLWPDGSYNLDYPPENLQSNG